MLILARRPGERVVIGDEILVTVMEVSGSTVRLGIEAPQGISIFREEIWLAVKEENRAAANAAADALPIKPADALAPGPVDALSTDASPARLAGAPPGEAADTLPSEPADALPSGSQGKPSGS
jgi:carbon storage regulator